MTANQTAAPIKIEPYEVGWMFVQEYYTILNKDPQKLHCFYTKNSSVIHGSEGDTVNASHGQQEIHKTITELGFHDCKVLVSNVDSLASLNGGIIIQVLGEMSNKGGPSKKFAQTFFLAEQPKGFYVLNDIFRFLKDEVEPDYDGDEVEEINHQQNHFVPEHPDEVIENHEISNEVPSAPSPVKQPSPAPVSESSEKKPESVWDSTPQSDVAAVPQEPTPLEPKPEVKPITPPAPKDQPQPPSSQQPPQHPPHQPQDSKPTATSWANLAASDSAKWGKQVAEVKGTVASIPPPQVQKTVSQTSNSGKPDYRRDYYGRREYQNDNMVYMKGPFDIVSYDMVQNAMSTFGRVNRVDIVASKTHAFIEFNDVESSRKAISQGQIIINDSTFQAEPRRPKSSFPMDRHDRRPSYGDRGGRGRGRGGMRSQRGGHDHRGNR